MFSPVFNCLIIQQAVSSDGASSRSSTMLTTTPTPHSPDCAADEIIHNTNTYWFSWFILIEQAPGVTLNPTLWIVADILINQCEKLVAQS